MKPPFVRRVRKIHVRLRVKDPAPKTEYSPSSSLVRLVRPEKLRCNVRPSLVRRVSVALTSVLRTDLTCDFALTPQSPLPATRSGSLGRGGDDAVRHSVFSSPLCKGEVRRGLKDSLLLSAGLPAKPLAANSFRRIRHCVIA